MSNIIRQVVQVSILGTPRLFTYAWEFDTELGGEPLKAGDKVELPPNVVQEEGSSGIVRKYGSDYTGPMKMIVRKIPFAAQGDDDLWAGEDVV